MAMATTLSDFDDVRFPIKIAFRFEGGPGFFTSVSTTSGGQEQRNVNWEDALHRYTVAHEFKTQTELDDLTNFFMSRRGKGVAFRFFDAVDYCSDQPSYNTALGGGSAPAQDTLPAAGVLTPQGIRNTTTNLLVGDAQEVDFQAIKTYPAATAGVNYERDINKLVALRVFVNAVEQTITTDYTVNLNTGLVTFNTAPGSGLSVTADYLFDVPVRFDTDELVRELEHFNLSNWRQVRLIEVRV